MKLFNSIKRSPLTVGIYNRYLNYRTKKVKDYIFVSSTGRCGTNSLEKILSCVVGVKCFHEPYPIMLNDGVDNNFRFERIKRIYVKRNAIGCTTYLETNHMFIQNFADLAVKEFGNKLKIIHLSRDPVSTARSFYQIGSIPGHTERGILYLIDPSSDKNLIKIRNYLEDEDPEIASAKRCLWYWYEVEARARDFQKKYPKLPFVRLTTESLNDVDKTSLALQKLGLDYSHDELNALVGTRANQKKHQKKEQGVISSTIDFNLLNEELRSILKSEGYQLF